MYFTDEEQIKYILVTTLLLTIIPFISHGTLQEGINLRIIIALAIVRCHSGLKEGFIFAFRNMNFVFLFDYLKTNIHLICDDILHINFEVISIFVTNFQVKFLFLLKFDSIFRFLDS